MRIVHVPYTKHKLTTLDLVAGDEILYRDENYFNQVNSGAYPNPTVIPNYNSTNKESEVPSDRIETGNMTAPIEEHKETGPLVPCKVRFEKARELWYLLLANIVLQIDNLKLKLNVFIYRFATERS